jgi:hypothetical protein
MFQDWSYNFKDRKAQVSCRIYFIFWVHYQWISKKIAEQFLGFISSSQFYLGLYCEPQSFTSYWSEGLFKIITLSF